MQNAPASETKREKQVVARLNAASTFAPKQAGNLEGTNCPIPLSHEYQRKILGLME